MNGRRMLWTTIIGTLVAMAIRRMKRGKAPMRLFAALGRKNMLQPFFRQMIRRATR